jgi:hypothetical protein
MMSNYSWTSICSFKRNTHRIAELSQIANSSNLLILETPWKTQKNQLKYHKRLSRRKSGRINFLFLTVDKL